MSPEQQQIKELEDRVKALEALISIQSGKIVLSTTTVVRGHMNADRLYTQRSGGYVELTT